MAVVAAHDAPHHASIYLRNQEQLADNLGAASLKLGADEIAGLNEISAPLVGDYPYGKGGTSQRFRKIEGGR